MPIFMIAMALVAAQDRPPEAIIADTIRLQGEYKKCLAEKTVELGKGNSESAETVLRAVSATCLPVEAELRSVYAETPIGPAHTEKLMQRDKKLGEDAGVAALLAARAERAR